MTFSGPRQLCGPVISLCVHGTLLVFVFLFFFLLLHKAASIGLLNNMKPYACKRYERSGVNPIHGVSVMWVASLLSTCRFARAPIHTGTHRGKHGYLSNILSLSDLYTPAHECPLIQSLSSLYIATAPWGKIGWAWFSATFVCLPTVTSLEYEVSLSWLLTVHWSDTSRHSPDPGLEPRGKNWCHKQ